MKRALLAIALVSLVAAAAVAMTRRRVPRSVTQPVAFDHARHAEEGLGCLDCHKTADSRPAASLPRIAMCALCHADTQGDSPEAEVVRGYVERKEEIPWVQANRMAGHVYFSHAMHVKLGKMDCAECHGDMSQATSPVTTSQVEHLTMARCMECHRERAASNDCLACHK